MFAQGMQAQAAPAAPLKSSRTKLVRLSTGTPAAAADPKLLVLYHQRIDGPWPERAYARLRQLYPGAFVVARDLDIYR